MTAFDYVVLTILFASIVVGLLRGLVKEVLSLVVWVAAFVLASAYGAEMATLLPVSVAVGTPRLVLGFAILFVGVLLLGALVNAAIAHIIAAVGLRVVDRGLGGLFGFVRGALIVMTAAVLAGLTDLPRQPVWRNAMFSGVTESAVRAVKPWLPDNWGRRITF